MVTTQPYLTTSFSCLQSLDFGVPQGTVLTPFLSISTLFVGLSTDNSHILIPYFISLRHTFSPHFNAPKTMVLNWELFCPPGDIQQYLKTVLVVTDRRTLLTSSGWRLRVLLKAYDAQGSRRGDRLSDPELCQS